MNPWWHQPFLWIHLDNLFRQVHFEDDSDNNIVELGLDEVQPLEPECFQVGDQVMGFFEPEGTFYPCEIVEVRELTYVVHFFDSPGTELYELDESQVLDQISLAEILAQRVPVWDAYSSIRVSSRLAVDGLLCTPSACQAVLAGCRRWPDGPAWVALVWHRILWVF